MLQYWRTSCVQTWADSFISAFLKNFNPTFYFGFCFLDWSLSSRWFWLNHLFWYGCVCCFNSLLLKCVPSYKVRHEKTWEMFILTTWRRWSASLSTYLFDSAHKLPGDDVRQTCDIPFDVAKGSCLGWRLFSLYMLSRIIRTHIVNFSLVTYSYIFLSRPVIPTPYVPCLPVYSKSSEDESHICCKIMPSQI